MTIELISAERFSMQELTELYNQTRVDYLVPMPPGLELEVRVLVDKTGTSSITFVVEGIAANGTTHFRARYVACITDFAQGKAVPIPEPLRRRITAYGNACRA